MLTSATRPKTGSLPRKRAEVVGLLVLLSLMSYFQRTSMSIAGPSIAREFSFSETQMGGVYSAFVLGYALCMIPGGWLADRLGPRRMIAAVALVTALFTGLVAVFADPRVARIAPVLATLIAIRFLLGCGTAPLYPAAARMNANWMPVESLAWVQGWIAAGAGIGGALSPLIITWIIAKAGWPSAFLLTAAGTVIIAVIWASRTADRPPDSQVQTASKADKVNWKLLLANRNLGLVTVSYAATGYFEYIFFYWIFYYLGEIRHLGSSQSAIYTTGLFAAWAVMAPLGGRLSDVLVRRFGRKIGSRLVPVVCLVTSAAFVITGINLQSAVATGLLLALALGLAAATDGSYWASAIQLGGRQSGAAGGIMNMGGNIGGFLAPVMTPWLASQYGWSAGLYFGCAIVTVGAALWLLIDVTVRHEPGTAAV